MWKAAFGGRSERGGGSTVDDTASVSSRRRRHRRSSNDDKSVVSSVSRRTDGDKDKDRDRKRHSRHESGVSYGSAPIPPRLTESAVNAFNANDDDDDIWEDEADLKSERRSKVSDGHERRRRKSSGRSERSRSRDRDGKHKKSSSGRSERSRSREREREQQKDGWTRKSSGRSERSRSRERDDQDRKRKEKNERREEKSSRVEKPNGKSRVSEIMDEADGYSRAPSSIASYDQFPTATNPSTVRFNEPLMSGALDSHVPDQFPGQNPSTYTKPDFDPNPHGAAADYYNDKGQSVNHQPGERAYTPKPPGGVSGSSSVAAPSGSTKPTKPAKSTKQSSASSVAPKPSKKSSRAASPPTSSAISPAVALGGAAAASAAANHHMQARASTQYERSEVSQNDFVHDRPSPSTISGPPRPIRHNSEPPSTIGASSSYYEPAPSTMPSQSGMYPPSQSANNNKNNNTGKYAAAGAAAAGMAAYGMSQHNQQTEYTQQSRHDQRTQYTQHSEVNSQYGPPTSYGPQSQYGSQYESQHGSQYGAQAPFTPERPGSNYGSASGGMPMGMHHPHEHKHRGPISRLKDGFLNLLSSPEDVAKMEEYTEYIGVCKNCFDPRSSPFGGPRKHHYHPRKKDSFDTLRRRSLERLQRRRSDESLRRTNSKIQKENRYYSSDHKSTSNSTYLAGGLAAAGAATAGAAMFNDRKNFDDTYSVKSGHRASSAVRRRGSNSSLDSRRRASRGRVGSERHEDFVTVRTKDGRVENRKVHRSRSGSTGRKSTWTGSAVGGAALGAAGAAAASRHRRRSSPDQESLHHDDRRYRSRSSSRSQSPGLGEIFGFTDPKPRRSGRRSPFGSYKDSRKEQQRRKEKGGFFNFSNGSASYSESGMAFGDVNGSSLSRKSSGKRKVSKQSSDEKLNKTLLGIGATAAALTAAHKLGKSPKQSRRPELGARRDVRVSQYGPSGHIHGPPNDDGEWVDELPSGQSSSDESGLAFDDGAPPRRLSSRQSMDSIGSQSSNDGLSAWGWRWGSKKPKKQRPITPPHREHASMSQVPFAGAAASGMATGAAYDAFGRHAPSDVGLVDNTVAPQAPMQYIEPQPLSDVGSRHPSMPGAFEDPPLQQPQPIAPFQPAFTQASPEDPLRPTAGPNGKPPMRRSASSPTRGSGSFMGDAAFIGGAAVATAGIIASQNRRASPGSVRFGFNGEQQEKFDREIREETEREDRERRRADRTRALKEEAERFAREEDERRVAEQKRRQREEEDKEHQRQLEVSQREEAYRREQANMAEESRRRADQEREAEEQERQMFNDRQIREELERKQEEREEMLRKKDKPSDERSRASSWKGPVAAGMAGAVAGAVLDGALHREGRERAQEQDDENNRRAREAYSTQTFEPSNEHSGAPITDDDLIDPDFFKRKRSPADLRRYEELSDEKLDELYHDREDYYNMPSQSQKDFFMPKELLDRKAEGKERTTDPYGDNEVDVYQTNGGEARHVHGNDFGKYGQAPFVHKDVPRLNVIAPTPPDSVAGSTRGDRSAPYSPLAEVQEAEYPANEKKDLPWNSTEDVRGSTRGAASDFYQAPFAQSVSDFTAVGSPGTEGAPPVRGWVEGETSTPAEEEARHIPGGFNDSVYEDKPQQSANTEAAWEPPLSKKDKKKRDKAGGKRESFIDSEPATPKEEDVPAARSVAFDEPQEAFEAPSSKKDKKKKGKAAKQSSTFDDEPVIVEPELEPTTAPEPLVAEEQFTPLSKKDKKKKGKKGMSFEDSEPNTPLQDPPRDDGYFAMDAPQDRSMSAFDEPEKHQEVDEFQPLSKKDKKKKGKKGISFEDSEPSTPVQEATQPEMESAMASPKIEEATWEPPLSKKEQKKREKAAKNGLPMEDSEPSTPVNERSMFDAEPEPALEIVEPEADNWEPPLSKKDKKKREKEAKMGQSFDDIEQALPLEESTELLSQSREFEVEPPLSKKDKKKREKEAKQGASFNSPEPSTPIEDFAEPMSASRELDAEPSWEPPVSKKDKKKREKEAKTAFAFEDPEPVNEKMYQEADPLVQEAEAAFEPPLSKKDKKKREKEAQKLGLGFDDSANSTPANERNDPLAEQSRELDNDPLASSQEVAAEPSWEPPLSKKDKKKREKEAQRESVPIDDAFEYIESKPATDDFGGVESAREPEAEAAFEPPLSKKDRKKREKEGKRQSVSFEDPELSTPADEFVEAEQSREPEGDAWEAPLSKKEQKKREKEAKSNGFGDVAAAVMTTAGVAAIADAVMKPEEDDYGFATGKKSKKSKKSKSDSFDAPQTPTEASEMPGAWDESSSDAAKDLPAIDTELSRDDVSPPAQEPSDDLWGSGDTKKSKKKKKRESGRFNEPATGSPLRSEVAFDDYLGDVVSKSGSSHDRARSVDAATFDDAQSTGYGRGGSDPAYYDDDYPAGGSRRSSPRGSPHGSPRAMSPESAVSAPTLERRRSSKSKSKRRSGLYEGEDFDDTRSIRSSATEPAPSSKKEKEKKSGLFGGLFSRSKSSDDKRDQSFLGDRVEDLPPLPLDSQASTTSASAMEEQDNGTPAPAEAVDQAVTTDALSQDAAGIKSAQSGEASSDALLSPDFPLARRPSVTPRPLSTTSVPLRFKPIPSSPSHPRERSMSFGSQTETTPVSPASASGSHKKPRPRSTEFREVRPLYLVSRNSKLEDVEEQLPGLPDSKPSSRASSVQGSEDWHSAAEDMSPPQPDADVEDFPKARKDLTIDLDRANQYRTEEEIMDTADQTTPKASDFPQTALQAPRRHSKQVPQFYTWEDLAKDEEMHEAAAREAEGGADAGVASSDGLGIMPGADERSSSPARKSNKKDKRKNKGLAAAAAAALAGGAVAGALLADSEKDKPSEPALDKAESDAAAPQTAESAQEPATTSSGSIYHEPVTGGGNTDIWGDPMGDAPAQPEIAEDVWGDEEFADRPSLPREMAADQEIDPMASPAEGALPARTGGPMTHTEEDFDDWFGSTDKTPKEPILLKGKKGKKAKKGKAAQAKPTSPAKEKAESSPALSPAEGSGSGMLEAEPVKETTSEEAAHDVPLVEQTAGDGTAEDLAETQREPAAIPEVSEPPTPTDESVQPESFNVETAAPHVSESDQTTPEYLKNITTETPTEASRELSAETPANAPEEATDDFFAPISAKKLSKKAKKNKKSQVASDDLGAEPVVESASIPEGAAADSSADAEQFLTPEDTPVGPSTENIDTAGPEPSAAEDEWASLSTTKKGKKAKKGKKQKADEAWAEPEPESEQAKEPIDSVAASEPREVTDTITEKNVALDAEPNTATADEATPSTEPATVPAPEKEAVEQPSPRGWFSWPFGAKKAEEKGLEVDPVTMQAREVPSAAEDHTAEAIDTGKQSDEFATPEEQLPETGTAENHPLVPESLVPEELPKDASISTELPSDSNATPETAGDKTDDVTELPQFREVDATSAAEMNIAPLEPSTKDEVPAVEQHEVLPADDQTPQASAEANEVTEDLWAAPSSKKKKGKKGKKSGQSTPAVVDEPPAPNTAEESAVIEDQVTGAQEPQAPFSEAREVPETAEPLPMEDDAFSTTKSSKKKGKKSKKSDAATEELPVEGPLETIPAPETGLDSEPVLAISGEPVAIDTVEAPKAEEQQEADSFWAPQPTKKKGKKAKKSDAAASASWDELVADENPIESTPDESKAQVSEESQPELQKDVPDAPTATAAADSETAEPFMAPVAEPMVEDVVEPEVEDTWAPLPSKKKGKKGKKAAKDAFSEPMQDETPEIAEAPSTEDTAKSLAVEPNEPILEQGEVPTEQPTENQLAADPPVEQETPAADTEDFWAPEPKGKKGKKGKKSRSDPADEASQSPEAPSAIIDDISLPTVDNAEAVPHSTEAVEEVAKEVPDEAGADDLWGAPAKGKKAKKGKKNKAALEVVETASEANDAVTESQTDNALANVAEAAVATEAAPETPQPAESEAVPEQTVEPEPAIDDDWSALTTSKKAKKGKKGKKTSFAADLPEPEAEPSESTMLASETADPEQDVVLPEDTEVSLGPRTIGDSVSHEDATPQILPDEQSGAQNTVRDLSIGVAPVDQVPETDVPENSHVADDPVGPTDAPGVQAADELEPLSTKKSKKDKKKSKKAQALQTDEPLEPTSEDLTTDSKNAQADTPAEVPESSSQGAAPRDVEPHPSQDESAVIAAETTPMDEADDFGSFATAKKSKRDKKKAKKGKVTEDDEWSTPTTGPEGAAADYFAGDSENQAPAADNIAAPASEQEGAAADYFAGHSDSQTPAADSTLAPAIEQEGAAADYYAGHPANTNDIEPAIEDTTDKDRANDDVVSTTRDATAPDEADPSEEFFAKKSKKDKKKSKKASENSWETPEQEITPAGAVEPAPVVVMEETQSAEADPSEDFGAFSAKKSKKDKKKAKKTSEDPWETPEQDVTPVLEEPVSLATMEETQPADADIAEEFGASSSKKSSKKDKKKGKKAAIDPWDTAEPETAAVPSAIGQPESMFNTTTDNEPLSSSQDDPSQLTDPTAEAPSTIVDDIVKNPEANADDEFALPTKKSKKDKKKGKKAKELDFDEPLEKTTTTSPDATSETPLANEQIAVEELPQDAATNAIERSLTDATDLTADAQPSVGEIDTAYNEIVPTFVEPSFADDTNVALQEIPATDAPQGDAEAEMNDIATSSSKKSKKDKKKSKKTQAVSWDEPEASTPTLEEPTNANDSGIPADEEPKTSNEAPVADEAPEASMSRELAPENEPESALDPQEEVDFFGSSSTKKSKKDKKKAKKGSAATPEGDESIVPERALEDTASLDQHAPTLSNDASVATGENEPIDAAANVVETQEPIPVPTEPVTGNDDDAFGSFSAKKSKEDKKKEKKSQEADVQVESPVNDETAVPEDGEQQQSIEAEDLWAAPAKKSKKDKKKSKNAQEAEPEAATADIEARPEDHELETTRDLTEVPEATPVDDEARDAGEPPNDNATMPETTEQQQGTEADHLWAAPAKKSKKDKKKSKKSQFDGVDPEPAAVPVDEPAMPDEQALEVTPDLTASARGVAAIDQVTPDATTPAATEQFPEDADTWGPIPAKKSKKDKKKAKKPLFDGAEPEAVPVDGDAKSAEQEPEILPDATPSVQEVPVTDQPASEATTTATTEQSPEDADAWGSMSTKKSKKDKKKSKKAKSGEEDLIGEDPAAPANDNTSANAPAEDKPIAEPAVIDLQETTQNSSEAPAEQTKEGTIESTEAATSDNPGQDIDFAATLAAGLADSGFDPNLVVDDPVFHRRASPPSGLAEADPEEVFTTSGKKKKGKGKKARDADVEPAAMDLPTSTEQAPDDFDAALSRGLQDSGFDPLLLAGATSSNQSPPSAELQDEDEFSFTKSNKKKKKGKKNQTEADDVPAPANDTLELSAAPVDNGDAIFDPPRPQSPMPLDEAKLDTEAPAHDDFPVPAPQEPLEAGEDEGAPQSKSKKRSKKDKKQQDRSLDVEESTMPVAETQTMNATIDSGVNEDSAPTFNAEPETALPSTEATGGDAWGAPTKKKKGKKQQDTDWQDGEIDPSAAEPPATLVPAEDNITSQDDFTPRSVEEAPPTELEQPAQTVEEDWAAPSTKKKGKKGKKASTADWQDADLPATPVEKIDPVTGEVETIADSTQKHPDPMATADAVPAEVEPTRDVSEDERAAPSEKKKKGKKNKKSQVSDWQEEEVARAPEIAALADTPDVVLQDTAEPELAESQRATTPIPEELPVASEATEEDWAAPSKKKDKKSKKKKGVEWLEPESTPSESTAAPVEDSYIAPEQASNESYTMARNLDGLDDRSVSQPADTPPVVLEDTQAADEEWGAPSKKKKGKKGKKNQDPWAESDTPVLDTEPTTPAAVDEVEAYAAQPELMDSHSRSIEGADIVMPDVAAASAFPSEPNVEPTEEEWGLPSKKKGKKSKQKQSALDFESETLPVDASETPAGIDTTVPSVEEAVREAEPTTDREIAFDEPAVESTTPAEVVQDDMALPIKKKGKKSKKNQMWADEEPQALTPEPSQPVSEAANFGVLTNDEPASTNEPTLPTDRSLDFRPEPMVTSTPEASTMQPEPTTGEEEWGLPSKKKGKKNKKKGAALDADLDPFISAPMDSPAPTSATDTADVSAAEGPEPAARDAFQVGEEMDVDDMDKAYKAYKKNKRKQKKMQTTPGDDNDKPKDQAPEQSLDQQPGASRGLDISKVAEPVRQPSPLANAEPSWSFAQLDDRPSSGGAARELARQTSRGSLTSRRSLEPLHVDTGSTPIVSPDASQGREQQQPEVSGSNHGRTASKDTPLEPTSRNRGSYLFQSPAPFQDSTPNNASTMRTPEQRGDASDYFQSRRVEPSADEVKNAALSPPAGAMSPRISLDPIPEEFGAHKRSLGDVTNITPMEPAGKMQRRTETPKAIREQGLSLSKSRESTSPAARSVSGPVPGLAPGDEERTLKRVVSDTRSPSAMSNRSGFSASHEEQRRALSRASNRSITPTLRRTKLSGDLRAESRTSNRRGDAGSAVSVGARTSPKTIPFEPPPTPPLNDEDEVVPGATRAAGMAETFQGYGGGQEAQASPTRPPSMRKRQSMHVMDLESRLEQLSSENRALQEAHQSRGLDDGNFDANGQSLQQALDARELELREKNNEIQHIQAMLEPMQQELNRLVQINSGLTDANRNLVDDTNGRYATLQNEHANANQQWQNTSRELENMRQEHSRLSSGMRDAVAAQLSTALAEKDHEIRKLKQELAEASEKIRALQVQIQSTKTSDFLNVRDEDYFDGACQKLCQHVQQWVLRFSKMSDNRICRLSSDLRDEKIEARLDNALLDGMDVDKLLGDRVRRRDVFMSVVMTMVWEYVFTRYLFGMDREQRQKLKALEKTLSEVGPPRAVAQWRATTLTLLAKRPAFSKQCSLDTEAVAHEIFGVLSALLTPPTGSEQQLLSSLTKVITVAVNLSVEMRTQRAEYIMLPPLQPEYDTNGDLVRKVHFNASLMNERSGLFTSNEALEADRAIVKIVLFPLVVKKGDEFGEGEEEIVVCPAQVLVHNDNGKNRKVVRVLSGAMEIDDPRRASKHSLLSRQGSMQF